MKTILVLMAASALAGTVAALSPIGHTKPVPSLQQVQQAIAPGSVSVTFPQITGQHCEVFTGQQWLSPTDGARFVKNFQGGGGIVYSRGTDVQFMVLHWPGADMGHPFQFAATYSGAARGAMQLVESKFGSGWPQSVSVH